MTGREIAKLLRCIKEKKGLEWTRSTLCQYRVEGVRYCALGMIASACGVPDKHLVGKGSPDWFNKCISQIAAVNDQNYSFEGMCQDFEAHGDNAPFAPVEEYIEASKAYAKSLGVKEEDCEG